MFDLEIPESAIVRDAQDEGIPLQSFKKNAAVTKAFDELAKRVQYVLNTPVPSVRNRKLAFFEAVPKFCAAAALVVIYGLNPRVDESIAPRLVAPNNCPSPKTKSIPIGSARVNRSINWQNSPSATSELLYPVSRK